LSAHGLWLWAVFFGVFLDNERVFGVKLKNPTTKKPAQLALCGLLNIMPYTEN
jgi:hypothetical protein